MTQTIVNLTLPIVTAKINQVLNGLAVTYDQKIPASTELHQKLTAYVIRRLPIVYVTMERDVGASLDSCSTCCYSAEQQAQIDQLIHQGLEALLVDAMAEELTSLSGALDTSGAASSWFG
ncbi:MAG: hypothetical protein ACOYMP_07285 [Nodosilinea sp.]